MAGIDADGYPGERLGRRGRLRGPGWRVPGSAEARTAAGEATASPAGPVPLAAGCGLPHAASRQASAAGQAAAAQRARSPGLTASCPRAGHGMARSSVRAQPLNVSMFSIFHRPPWRRAVTANIAPA